MERLTGKEFANAQLLYFTSSSLNSTDEMLYFISDCRDGNPDLYRMDLRNREVIPLTRNREGVMKSYVYFDGFYCRGFGKASVCLDEKNDILYYLQGREIRRIDRNGGERVLAEYPAGQMTGFCHVSADGRKLCVPTVDEQALWGERRGLPEGFDSTDIDDRIQCENLSSYLRVYAAESGELLDCLEIPRAWVTHVQFSPVDSNLILFNHEWARQSGKRRIWLCDCRSRTFFPLRPIAGDRRADDWVCHEIWSADGNEVIYHGQYAGGAYFIGNINRSSGRVTEISMPEEYSSYGHYTLGPAGKLVTDGYYRRPDDPPGSGGYIALVNPDWNTGSLEWKELCRHDSSWNCQCSHPHPIFDHSGKYVYFTSDREGFRAVYRVEVTE